MSLHSKKCLKRYVCGAGQSLLTAGLAKLLINLVPYLNAAFVDSYFGLVRAYYQMLHKLLLC